MMDQFLTNIEGKAFRMAEIATGNRDEALDIVQEAMFALVKNYSDRQELEWGPLFHRILQSKIRDWYRRSTVKRRLIAWWKTEPQGQGEQSVEEVHALVDKRNRGPLQQLQSDKVTEKLIIAIKALPLRQQQAFMLRAWEGLSVKETAQAMSCSEGSIKTHYARALSVLRKKIEADWS